MVQIIHWVYNFKTKEYEQIFISHMVQIIRKIFLIFFLFLKKYLYIPHGSDNTTQTPFPFFPLGDFISHMVQIIRSKEIRKQYNIKAFISHMVQIIRSIKELVEQVQKQLYIPHGSDNTELNATKQMFYSKTLYPTWFR